jgi:hypothetical protein
MEGETLIRFVVCLSALLILWAISSWLVRYRNSGVVWHKQETFLQRVDFLPLSQTHALHLIKVGQDKMILLSASPNTTDLIMNISADELKALTISNNQNIQESPLFNKIKETIFKGGKSA